MTFFKQTELKYKTIPLGFGTGSIYDYGCYMVSLCNGLQMKGYGYDPEQINEILKVKNLWTGTTKNLIDVTNIVGKWGDIFTSFKRVDAWGTVPSLDEILKPDLVAIGEVDAAGIGGTLKSQHFVLITKKAANGHAIIYDPWRGVEEDIAVHWSTLGYIKSLRLFGVKPSVVTPQPTPTVNDQTKYDFGTPWGIMELGAVRSTMNDQKSQINNKDNEITQLRAKIEKAKLDLA